MQVGKRGGGRYQPFLKQAPICPFLTLLRLLLWCLPMAFVIHLFIRSYGTSHLLRLRLGVEAMKEESIPSWNASKQAVSCPFSNLLQLRLEPGTLEIQSMCSTHWVTASSHNLTFVPFSQRRPQKIWSADRYTRKSKLCKAYSPDWHPKCSLYFKEGEELKSSCVSNHMWFHKRADLWSTHWSDTESVAGARNN